MYSAITNFLVLQQLEKVAPNLASEFQQKHKCFYNNSNITLDSVVEKFLVDSSVYNHMLEVTPHLANEFLRKNPFVCQNLVSIQTILTQFQERDNPSKRKASSNHTDSPCKKIKTSSELTQNSVVYHHLSVVTPKLANEFKEKHSVMFPIETSLQDLVDQYFKENYHIQQKEKESQTSEGIIQSSSPDSIQVITLSDEEVIDVSSNTCSESSSEEDTDYDIIPIPNEEKDKSEVSVINNLTLLKPQASYNKMKPVISRSQPNLIYSSSKNNLTHNPKKIMLDENMNEYRHISDSCIYSDLGKTLEKDSVVDKIVQHILNENIRISQLNFDHIVLSAGQVKRHSHASVPSNVELGSFSLQDDNTITSNWNKLVTEMNIDNPEETFKLFSKRSTKEEKLKANVLGIYLSQGMEKLRLAADVFHHSEKIIINFVKGKISQSEHDLIMDHISKHGQTTQAFNSCAKLLNRRYPAVISKYYFQFCDNLVKKGPYTSLENKICITEIMEKSNIKTVLDIINVHGKEGTVKKETFKEIATKLGRPVHHIVMLWEQKLKPLLLQYHAGTVNFDVRRILANHLLDKNIVHMQDIPWDQLLINPQFAGHTNVSLRRVHNGLIICVQNKYKCKREEVTIKQIGDYANDNLHPHKTKPKEKIVMQKQELIDCYKSLIDSIKNKK